MFFVKIKRQYWAFYLKNFEQPAYYCFFVVNLIFYKIIHSMKHKITLLACCLFLTFLAKAQEYSRVKINIEGKDIAELAKLGVEVDHGIFFPNRFLINDFHKSEIDLIRKAGFETSIEIEDVQTYYSQQSGTANDRSIGNCEQQNLKDTHKKPSNFQLGSMGGFYTYEELWAELDKMRALYPNLISTYQAIDTFKSHEKRPIRWLRISDNPNQEEAEPKMLYTAVHHAREPLGLSQLVYYMWYLLENYNNNQEIKQLINNTEMYFVPMLNPDGYVFNETSFPDGGGLWRKNRRDNGNGTFGVDLNRNYGYEWAFSNTGSSPNPQSETYRGPSAFSEPESRAIKFFCEKYDFKIALNYHTYGNLLIYPWGYNDNLADSAFREIGELFSAENNFKAGTGIETVAYNVNGTSDDWMWGAKQVFAFTPEASTVGFWPTITQIKPLCGDLLHMNLVAAHTTGSYALLRATDAPVFLAQNGNFNFEIKRYGFDNQPIIVKIAPFTGNIISKEESKTLSLKQFETANFTYNYALKNGIKTGELTKFVVTLSDSKGTFVKIDTITAYFGGVSALKETADNLSGWTNIGGNGNWGITNTTFKSAPSCITDSPSGNYIVNTDARIRTKNYITIPNKKKVILRFWAKWDIEKETDYAAVSVSDDNINYQYACGKYTHDGGFFQLEAEPIYDGKSDWVLEEIDLSEYAGNNILLRFSFSSDFQNNKDGMYIDDIEIVAEDPTAATTSTISLDELDFQVFTFSNPTHETLQINLDSAIENAELSIFNTFGQLIKQQSLTQQSTILDVSNLAAGTYFYQIKHKKGAQTKSIRFVKL